MASLFFSNLTSYIVETKCSMQQICSLYNSSKFYGTTHHRCYKMDKVNDMKKMRREVA